MLLIHCLDSHDVWPLGCPVIPGCQVYTPFHQGDLRAERLADHRGRGLAAGKNVKVEMGDMEIFSDDV